MSEKAQYRTRQITEQSKANYKKGYEDAKAGRASNPAKTVVKRPEQQTGRKPKTTSIYDLD